MPDHKNRQILLVEDEPLIAMSEKLQLEKHGYSVRTATCGRKAIEVVEEASDIDLILMDIDLGAEIDGTQAAEVILRDHDIPIVFLSSHTEPEIVEKTERITSYGYVVKSSSVTVLDASIKMAFKLFDAKQAHGRKEDELRASEERFRLAQEMSPDGFTILHPVHNEEQIHHTVEDNNLREQRDFAESLIETAQTIILVLDAEGNIVRFNPYTAELLGYSLDAVAGKNWIESFVKLEDRETIKIVLHKTISDDQANRHVNSILTKDGQVILVEWCSKSLRDSEGQAVGILATGVDITERAQLQRSLELRSEILEHIGQAVIATDLQGEVFLWNRMAEIMYGISSEGAIGKSIIELTPTEQTKDQAVEIMEELSQGRTWAGEFTVRGKDGGSFPAHVTNTPLFDNSGHLSGIIGISTDITERKRAEETIQRQLAEKEILLREVHHRVKNNMATIEGLLLLQADSTASAHVKATLQDTSSRIQSMRVLYDRLLISKSLEEVSVKAYAEGLIDSCVTALCSGTKITVEKYVSDFMITPEKAFALGIVINELLTNTFKYAFCNHDGGVVKISIDQEENEGVLIIKDDGMGYNDRALRNESPGFGLTVVKMLAEQLGGRYSLSNDDGAKSVVRFQI